MSDVLRREKTLVKQTVNSYLKATSEEYTKMVEGSPSYIIYYQLDNEASRQDTSLETVHSLVGANTPNKYKRIYDVIVYGVDSLDVANEVNERGLQSQISGEFVVIPDTIRPYPGEFFVFDCEGLEDHLFQITDVQYDRASPKKYFKCQFKLYQDNTDLIFNNVSDDYALDYDSVGDTSSASIVKKSDVATSDSTKSLVDSLMEKYEKLFYQDETDSFLYFDGDAYYWSPYLQHFLHETGTLSRYTKEFMTEIYIGDIDETNYPEYYKEAIYRDSLFRAVEVQNSDITFNMNFINVDPVDLKLTRNLPFFQSSAKFKMLSPVYSTMESDPMAYLNAQLLLVEGNNIKFADVDHYHKVHVLDSLHIARLESYLKENDIIYECNKHELCPTRLAKLYKTTSDGETYLEMRDISTFANVIESETNTDNFILQIIVDYLNDSLEITDSLINTLNKGYYAPSLKNYILIPLMIYCIKQAISSASST